MDLPAGTLAQVRKLKDGRMVVLEDDVCNVVKDIQAIDRSLRVRWSEVSDLFVVYQDLGEGREHLVTTSQVLDQRLVERIRQVVSPDYDYAGALEAAEAEADRQHQHELDEQIGEVGERLHHAMLKDLNLNQDRIFVG